MDFETAAVTIKIGGYSIAMRSFVPSVSLTRALGKRAGLLLSLATLLFIVPAAHAQFGGPDRTQVHDAAALKPPPGDKIAIIEFDDMECPDCAAANPILIQAHNQYHIPWIRHDFPLPFHPWSFEASVYARWFQAHSKKLAYEYRNAVFANQPSIINKRVLLSFTQKFAAQHGLQLPFMIDPTGKLADEVKVDRALGQRIGINHTPTIFIVTAGTKAPPYTEVLDPQHLFQDIDRVEAEMGTSK